VVLAVALGVFVQGCGGPPGPVVMVSGRDDHGLLERPAVAFQRSPDDPAVVGSAQDGAFVRVLEERGPWFRVRTIEPRPEEGWVNDHDLRGAATRRDRGEQVTFVDAAVRDGVVMVLVRPRSGEGTEWLPAAELREIGAR